MVGDNPHSDIAGSSSLFSSSLSLRLTISFSLFVPAPLRPSPLPQAPTPSAGSRSSFKPVFSVVRSRKRRSTSRRSSSGTFSRASSGRWSEKVRERRSRGSSRRRRRRQGTSRGSRVVDFRCHRGRFVFFLRCERRRRRESTSVCSHCVFTRKAPSSGSRTNEERDIYIKRVGRKCLLALACSEKDSLKAARPACWRDVGQRHREGVCGKRGKLVEKTGHERRCRTPGSTAR
jgi:hypothetical protein